MLLRLGKFVETEQGKVIMSVILGFGLATLFREACKGRNCFLHHAPPLEDIQGQVYKHDNKCYKYDLEPTKCNKSKRIVRFA